MLTNVRGERVETKTMRPGAFAASAPLPTRHEAHVRLSGSAPRRMRTRLACRSVVQMSTTRDGRVAAPLVAGEMARRPPGAPFVVPYGANLQIRPWEERDRDACVALIGAVLNEYGLVWEPEGADSDVVHVGAAYQRGEFWVVEDITAGVVVGTGAFYEVEGRGEGVVEIRKMYLNAEVRGLGLGKFLLSALEHRAVDLGYWKSVIETASVLKEACELYARSGYTPATGLETERCDTVLEKIISVSVPRQDVDAVEAVDSTRGWRIASVSRADALKHRILFRAVVVLVESNGRIFCHRRSMKKASFPGRTTAFVTGAVAWNEPPLEAAQREVEEEIGISRLEFCEPFSPFVADKDDGRERILFHPYHAVGQFTEEDVVFDPEEVHSGLFLTREEIAENRIGGTLWNMFNANVD